MTLLLPVTLPMALSAVLSDVAAALDAKVSGSEMPKATKVMAVTLSLRPTRHPKMPARSPTMTVKSPIIPRETKKQGHPPPIPAGGINAKMICKCQTVILKEDIVSLKKKCNCTLKPKVRKCMM